MTTPVQPGDDHNQEQQPQQPQQLSREQLEAQYNQQTPAPQQPTFQQPGAPQYQAPQHQTPQYQAPGQPQYSQDPQQPYGQHPYQQAAQPQQGQYQQQPYQQQQAQYAQNQYAQGQYQQPGTAYGDPGVGEPFDGATNPDDLTRPLYGATFGQSIRRFFKNYVNFKGRASRSEYWWVQLFMVLLYLVPSAIYFVGLFMMLGGSASSYDYSSGEYNNTASNALLGTGVVVLIVSAVIMLALTLGLLLPSISIAWRRLHDANFAGPFFFLSFIPYAGGIVLIVFTVLASKPMGRRFDEISSARI